VGAGAVVTKDVAPYALVAGVPARRVGWMCQCGERLSNGGAGRCPVCGTEYERAGDGIRPVATKTAREGR
jgi:UDP-2-acetamido-3-amino-2,3-dideoxy-glucuronate N-acetyltransferase